MATVSKEMAEQIMRNNGYFKNDPRVMQVVQYDNMVGRTAYAILYAEDVAADRYKQSQFVNYPVVIWAAK